MKIIGDIKTANKFYIIDSMGSIRWVPNIEMAKKYVSNPSNIEWYQKDIYATNEEVVKDKTGKIKLASQVNKKTLNIKTIKSSFEDFKQQANSYVFAELNNFAKQYKYDSILSMISWKDSTVAQYANEAQLAIEYRDRVYEYHFSFLNNLEDKILNDTLETADLSEYYETYLKDFPKNNKEGN